MQLKGGLKLKGGLVGLEGGVKAETNLVRHASKVRRCVLSKGFQQQTPALQSLQLCPYRAVL